MSIFASNDEHGEFGDGGPLMPPLTDDELIAQGRAKLAALEANWVSDSLFEVMEWAARYLPDLLIRWDGLRQETRMNNAAIAAKQQRYARQHDVYRGALRDAARVFADLGITNPPPRFVEALALEEIPR
ncbi:hypothetical protein [Nocardia otitidiscaviarum]|uniref:hypothetical protein n=1 Tax=Nocardia otitidiscaviarum TaxID=1823 RepID=UPI0004A6AE81|nr:hypothetical protein [Nocardia otitidiscaviarum]